MTTTKPFAGGTLEWNATTDRGLPREVAALLADARGGDGGSLGELLDHYRSYLLLLATTQIEKRLQPRVSPSDIVQEAMVKAHRHFDQFRGQSEGEFVAWLREILLNSLGRFVERHVLAAKRDVRREISLDQFEAAFEETRSLLKANLPARGKSPSAAAQQVEESQLLGERLADLPRSYREVLMLRNIHGLSFEEVAERLNRSPGATRMLWLRAIEKLRAVYGSRERT